jgi:hypothetical protein
MNRKSVTAVVWMAVLIAVYLTPLASVLGASPPQPVPNVAPQFSNIDTWYPQGQSAAKTSDNIFVTLKAWDTDSAKPTITYSNVPIGGSTANKAMWDDGKHVDGSANDTVYGADSMDSIGAVAVAGCDYFALPITIFSAPDTVVTSAPVTVDNWKPILKEMKIEYPANQLALKTGDPVRIVTNTTDSCTPSGPVKIPIGGMYFVAADLTKIGGKPTEGMYDDGQHGDGAIKDGVYATPQVTALSQDPSNQFETPVIGIDIAGNRVVDKTLQVKIDNTPPVASALTIQYASGSTAKDGDKIKVQATVTDTGPVNGIYRVYADASAIGGDNQAPMLGTGTYTSGDITVATGGAIGRFKLKVVAIDIAGNKGEQEVNVNIDNGAVAIKIAGLIDNQIVQGTYTFHAVTIDAVQVKINIFGEDRFMAYNVTNGSWEYTVDTTAKADGPQTVTVTALGEFGTQGTDSKTFRIDNHAPVINVLAPPAGTYLEGSILFDSSKVSITDQYLVGNGEYNIDGLGWNPVANSWDTKKVDDGPHTVHFRAWDEAMHYTYAELPLVIDNTPPTAVKVQVPDESRYITGEWKMMFDAYDKVGVSTVELTFDKGKTEAFTVNLPSTGKYFEFTLNTSRFNYELSKYPSGEHTYDVTVHDKAWEAANIDETYVKKATHENFESGKFKVDDIAPSIVSQTAALGNTTPQNGLIVLLFAITDNPNPGSGIATVEIRIDNGEWMDIKFDTNSGYYNYSWRTGKKDNGIHKVEVRATDKLGHVNVQAYSLSIDNTDTSSMILALVGALVFVTLFIFAFLFHRVKAKAIRETPPPPPPQPKMKKSSGGEAQ